MRAGVFLDVRLDERPLCPWNPHLRVKPIQNISINEKYPKKRLVAREILHKKYHLNKLPPSPICDCQRPFDPPSPKIKYLMAGILPLKILDFQHVYKTFFSLKLTSWWRGAKNWSKEVMDNS